MKISSYTKLLLVAAVSFSLALPAVAQDDEKSGEKETSPGARVLNEIHQHIKAGEWSDVKSKMTEEAWDDWCENLVVSSHGMANLEIDTGLSIPGLDEAQEAISEVLKKHELDELEIKNQMFEIRVGDMDDEPEAPEDEEVEEASEQSREILATLDKNDSRLQVIQDLWEAQATSPFNFSVFGGDVENEEEFEGGVSLTIKPVAGSSGDSGVSFQVMAPPVVIDMRKEGDTWKYAGMNGEKTAKAMKDFNPGMGGVEDFDDF